MAPPRIGGSGGRASASKHMPLRIARRMPGSCGISRSARHERPDRQRDRHADVDGGASQDGHRAIDRLACRRAPHAGQCRHAGRGQEEAEHRPDDQPAEMAGQLIPRKRT